MATGRPNEIWSYGPEVEAILTAADCRVASREQLLDQFR